MGLKKLLLDLFFPKTCLGCGLLGEHLCHNCFKEIKLLDKQCCPACGQVEAWGRCCPSRHNNYELAGVWSALDYNQKIVAKLIKALKYNGIKELAEILSQASIPKFQSLINLSRFYKELNFDLSAPLLVPVPLSPRRFRERGFNQAELIANHLAEYFGWEISLELKRQHRTKHQAELNKSARAKNNTGVFFWKNNVFHGRQIIIIDDVITTGATLTECAKAINSAEPKAIWGITIAHG